MVKILGLSKCSSLQLSVGSCWDFNCTSSKDQNDRSIHGGNAQAHYCYLTHIEWYDHLSEYFHPWGKCTGPLLLFDTYWMIWSFVRIFLNGFWGRKVGGDSFWMNTNFLMHPPPKKKAHFVSWDQESMYKSNEELSISSDVVKLHRLTKYLKGSQWDIL